MARHIGGQRSDPWNGTGVVGSGRVHFGSSFGKSVGFSVLEVPISPDATPHPPNMHTN